MAKQKIDNQQIIKCVILGSPASGKSKFSTRYASGEYTEQYIPTPGLDLCIKNIHFQNRLFQICLWDTAGNPQYQELIKAYWQSAHFFIVAFDVTSKESFNTAQKYLKNISWYHDHKPIILVGTKCDLNKPVVSKKNMNQLYPRLAYFETSSKEDKNISEVFQKGIELSFINKPHKVVDKKVQNLIQALERYITRIESHTNKGVIDFTYGFWFCRKSRALNREANYRLAEKLKKELEQNVQDDLRATLFSKSNLYKARAEALCSQERGFSQSKKPIIEERDYVERGIHWTSELSKIIRSY